MNWIISLLSSSTRDASYFVFVLNDSQFSPNRFVCVDVTICDLVHTMETGHGLC